MEDRRRVMLAKSLFKYYTRQPKSEVEAREARGERARMCWSVMKELQAARRLLEKTDIGKDPKGWLDEIKNHINQRMKERGKCRSKRVIPLMGKTPASPGRKILTCLGKNGGALVPE